MPLLRIHPALVLGLGLLAGLPAPVRATTVTLTDATVAQLGEAMAAGAITSEKITQLFLARIEAYEKSGPRLHALLTINPRARDEARALDAERKARGPRGPLHGIPILLKDNIDTADLPTTGGFYALRDSIPPRDAEQTRRLRAAGCIILGKTNLSEFASGNAVSTLGGTIRNPHALDHSPSGSSGGNGAGIAAGFAMFALGTDTGGSIRGPSSSNGIAGLKPTFGLNGRGGIIPLALSLDTVGPMARNVADLAAALNVMAGPDPRDPSTGAAAGRIPPDYTATLRRDALRGVRLGVVREFMRADPAVAAVMETALAVLRRQGATVIDVKIPTFVLAVSAGAYETIRNVEFRYQVEDYLATLPRPDLPKKIEQIVADLEAVPRLEEAWEPNPVRLETIRRGIKAGTYADEPYRSAVNEGRKIVRANLEFLLAHDRLDALVWPTSSRPASRTRHEVTAVAASGPGAADAPPTLSLDVAAWLANLGGWPDLIVPAGFVANPTLPVTLSFVGPAFSEARLLAFGYAFEQALPMRVLPVKTPILPGETITY